VVRYLKLFLIQLRASVQLSMAYRVDFFFEGLTALFWSATTFVPLFVAFHQNKPIAGWTFDESLLVLAFFLLLKSVLEGSVSPSLLTVVEHIRNGTLDFVLLKPADAQFLVSTAKFEPSASLGAVAALSLFVTAFVRLGRPPTATGVLMAVALLATSVVLLYSLWILVVSAAFYVIRVDNLSYLLTSLIDAARWPAAVFRGTLHILFTFVVPLALMTTYPAEALLGRFSIPQTIGAMAGALVFAALARVVWVGSLSRYTSASS
jgi:ABC-2 type transport system permease protein